MRQAEKLLTEYIWKDIFLGTQVGVADLYYYPYIWNSLQAVISNNFINILVSEVKKQKQKTPIKQISHNIAVKGRFTMNCKGQICSGTLSLTASVVLLKADKTTAVILH